MDTGFFSIGGGYRIFSLGGCYQGWIRDISIGVRGGGGLPGVDTGFFHWWVGGYETIRFKERLKQHVYLLVATIADFRSGRNCNTPK